MEEKLNFVDKKLVHKVKDENVHIYNLRRALPREIEVDFFEKECDEKLTKEEKAFLLKYYIKRTSREGNPAYVLRNIPISIRMSLADKLIEESAATQEEIDFLHEFYTLDQFSGKYLLQKKVTEVDEIKILSIFKLRDLHITDQEKYEIAIILEKFNFLEKKTAYFANVFIDQTHSYFFEHPQEHVPGMILIEVARQMSMACAHLFGKVPLGAVFMLTKLDSSFSSYCELHFSTKVRAKLDNVKFDQDGIWSYYLLTFTFFQRQKVVSSIVVEAMIVNQTIFKKIRRDKIVYDQLPRFYPLSGIENNISIRDSKKRYLATILNISLEGFMLKFPNPNFILKDDGSFDETKAFEFFMFFERIGFIHGQCEMKWAEPYQDGFIAGFHITKKDQIDEENLKEALKFHFRIKEDREIL